MKNTLSLLVVAGIIMGISTPSFAMPRPVEKLKDGVTTVITSPLEVKDHTMAEAKGGSFLPFSITGGFFKGVFYMGKKAVGGALDIVTFPLDN